LDIALIFHFQVIAWVALQVAMNYPYATFFPPVPGENTMLPCPLFGIEEKNSLELRSRIYEIGNRK
jgi:hypothetical protein